MIEAIINLGIIVLGIVLVTICVISLVKWDGKKSCEPEDCETCPYSGVCDEEGGNSGT